MSKNVSFLTLGCAKNEVDSASMQRSLIEAGYRIVEMDEEPDCIVVNTCSFIQPAIEESLDVVFEIADEEAVRQGRCKLVVCGCMPSRFGEDLSIELTEPDAFVPCKDEDGIVEVIDGLLGLEKASTTIQVDFPSEPSEYVKISDGCNRFCSFCTIPFIRGRYHSYTYDEIERDVERKVAGGAREIVLIAQDSGIWGLDLSPRETLASLLERLASSYPSTWFRVMYLQPAGMTDDLLDVVASHENICSYFDIPLQHCDGKLLRSMNRQGDRESIEAMLARVRSRIPDVVLRTTLIVGYPGETDDQFDDLCDFVEDADFDYVGIFSYSREDGTKAAELPDQVDEGTKLDRLQTLRDIADSVSSARISRRIGSTCSVLVLGREEDGQLYGRAQSQAPEVDGVIYLAQGEIGDIVTVTIGDTLLYEMEAQ